MEVRDIEQEAVIKTIPKKKKYKKEKWLSEEGALEYSWASLVPQMVKNPDACNVGDLGSIPGLGRSPGEGNHYPLQYSGLENSMDCRVHRAAKSCNRATFTFTGERHGNPLQYSCLENPMYREA